MNEAATTRQAERWQLSRAGIINVYQYENEILHFGGGRLLLRGVNGSGKSTAMNMLLPFLLTARQGRIDAAGEQRRILRSWMLDGRDDAQPVGYLWIEFERHGQHLTCGCGIKANRQSDNVTTWWFVTERRPAIDLHLVEGGTALSADALRAVLDDDPVYSDAQRRSYREEIERRLFGGISIDQHLALIDVVRNPRVGDRVDVDLAARLVDSLPQLSEHALAEAAQPLDDLDDHRRNVAELERTQAAVRGLLDSYRSYCLTDVHARLAAANDVAEASATLEGQRRRARQKADAARARVVDLDTKIARLRADEQTLSSEITALRASPTYQQGEQLEALRQRVGELKDTADRSEAAAGRAATTADRLTEAVRADSTVAGDDLGRLNTQLQEVHDLAATHALTHRGPSAVAIATSSLGGELHEPTSDVPVAAVGAELGRVDAAIASRLLDIDEITARRADAERAERELVDADRQLEQATESLDSARTRRDDALRTLTDEQTAWRTATGAWVEELTDHERIHSPDAVTPASAVLDESDDEAALHDILLERADGLIAVVELRAAQCDHDVELTQAAVDDAEALVAELDARTEPDPPRLPWQRATDHCLADLVDFADHLDDQARAGLEGALEASGLLSARVTSDGTTQLDNGELVAIVEGGVDAPLSALLTVTIPEQLTVDIDAGLVAKLLDSISTESASSAVTVAAPDGTFRVGALRGRHVRGRAEHIGVTARREALERARTEARDVLLAAEATLADAHLARDAAHAVIHTIRTTRAALPSTTGITTARSTWQARSTDADAAEHEHDEAGARQRTAEAAAAATTDELHRTAATLALPADADGLTRVADDLQDLRRHLNSAHATLEQLRRAVHQWREQVVGWRTATNELTTARREADDARELHRRVRAELATIQDSLGLDYQELLATIEHTEQELAACVDALGEARGAHEEAITARADTQARAGVADEAAARADEDCEGERQALLRALDQPGYLDALVGGTEPGAQEGPDSDSPTIARHETGTTGLSLAVASVRTAIAPAPTTATNADGVRASLQQRRPSIGAGWDAEARQPDPLLPLVIEVNGPTGRSPLPAARRDIDNQHARMAGLLNAKQDAALRELLQGLIAREVAEKIHGARELVERMNARLSTVTTSHDIGVRVRWRRSIELDEPTTRLVELLATLPDLRTADDEQELRSLLAARLTDARRLQPDLPYRQLIADTLDYKRWHDLTIFVRRGEREETLGRNIRLSEGEKKLVTYVPLFAAVAASYDALAERAAAPGEPPASIARFVLLDDAFAKVSEDNHAKLFGLLVDLDLDLIATSERLWGTHATVPELAITEVVRDAAAGVILLEHFRWDGHTLERLAAT